MSNMLFKLYRNELIKILKCKVTKVFAFLFCIMLVYLVISTIKVGKATILIKSNNEYAQTMLDANKKLLSEYESNKDINKDVTVNEIKARIFIFEYAIKNNIPFATKFIQTNDEYWKSYSLMRIIKLLNIRENFISNENNTMVNEIEEEVRYLFEIVENDDYEEYAKYRRKILESTSFATSILKLEEEYKLELYYKYKIDASFSDESAWKYGCVSKLCRLKTDKIISNLTYEELKDIENQEKIEIFKLENNIADGERYTRHQNMYNTFMDRCQIYLLFLLGVYILVLTCFNIQSEFSDHTINQLLIFPVKRKYVIISKILAITTTLILCTAILFIISIFIGKITFNMYNLSPYIYVNKSGVCCLRGLLFYLIRFYTINIKIFAYMLFCTMLSVFIRNGKFGLIISLFCYMCDKYICNIIEKFIDIKVIQLIPCYNFDFNSRIFENLKIYGENLQYTNHIPIIFSVALILILCVLFIVTTVFKFEDVDI